MDNASTSHGSNDFWFFFSFALKKPARRSLSSLDMYNVAPIPGLLTAPSVTIQRELFARGKVYSFVVRQTFEHDGNNEVDYHPKVRGPWILFLQWNHLVELVRMNNGAEL
jgi:hypothetical protein